MMSNIYIVVGLIILLLGGGKFIFDKYKSTPIQTFNKWIFKIKGINQHFNLRESIILAIVHVESSGNPKAVGDNGRAIGLMQVTQPALTDVNEFFGKNFSIDDLKNNPDNQLYAGIAYLNILFRRTNGDMDLTIRGYNAGLSRARENKAISQTYLMKVKKYSSIFQQYLGGDENA